MSNSSAQPFVSIVIPVYNGETYLRPCIESVMAQTYQNWELIINNNKSEDDTLKIAEEYASKDSRIKVFTNDDFLILVKNWATAVSRISKETKYIKVLGADDYIFPECIEKKVTVFEANPSVGICSSYRLVYDYVDMTGLDYWAGNVFNGKDILKKHLNRELDIVGSISTVMFSIEHLKKLPRYPQIFDETTYHEDTELEFEMMDLSDVGFVFQVLSYSRKHKKTATSTTVVRHNTLFQLNERTLFVYKGNDKELNKRYRICRLDYAFFLFCQRLKFNKETVNWHKQYIERPFTFSEYFWGIITRNIVVEKCANLFIKIINKFRKSKMERISYKVEAI